MPGGSKRGSQAPRGRRAVSPLVALLALLAIGGATLFGERVPLLHDIAGYFSELVGGGPQVEGLTGPAEIVRITDGDTIRVRLQGQEESVRLIGIDTPEKHRGAKLNRDAEASPLSGDQIQALGEQASAYAERLMASGEVYLQFGTRERDRYGRLLAYVYVRDPEGEWEVGGERFTQLNLELARAGWADPLTIPPNVEFAEDYVAAAQEARSAGRGMWSEGWVALAE